MLSFFLSCICTLGHDIVVFVETQKNPERMKKNRRQSKSYVSKLANRSGNYFFFTKLNSAWLLSFLPPSFAQLWCLSNTLITWPTQNLLYLSSMCSCKEDKCCAHFTGGKPGHRDTGEQLSCQRPLSGDLWSRKRKPGFSGEGFLVPCPAASGLLLPTVGWKKAL